MAYYNTVEEILLDLEASFYDKENIGCGRTLQNKIKQRRQIAFHRSHSLKDCKVVLTSLGVNKLRKFRRSDANKTKIPESSALDYRKDTLNLKSSKSSENDKKFTEKLKIVRMENGWTRVHESSSSSPSSSPEDRQKQPPRPRRSLCEVRRCRYACDSKISDFERRSLCEYFRGADFAKRRNFVRLTALKEEKLVNRRYFLLNKQGEMRRVCLDFYLGTLLLNQYSLLELLPK